MSIVDLKILDLEKGATKEQITKKYRKLAKLYHPDKYKNPEDKKSAQEMFQTISNAYSRLTGEQGIQLGGLDMGNLFPVDIFSSAYRTSQKVKSKVSDTLGFSKTLSDDENFWECFKEK